MVKLDLLDFSDFIAKVILIKEVSSPRIYILKYKIELKNDTSLYVKEVTVFADNKIDYACQWQKLDTTLIIRWDNAHEHPSIESSPYHQHVGSESNILPSEPMTLEKVLNYIKAQIAI